MTNFISISDEEKSEIFAQLEEGKQLAFIFNLLKISKKSIPNIIGLEWAIPGLKCYGSIMKPPSQFIERKRNQWMIRQEEYRRKYGKGIWGALTFAKNITPEQIELLCEEIEQDTIKLNFA